MIRIPVRKNRRVGGVVGLIVGLGILGFCLLFALIFVIPSAQARLSGVKTQGIVQDVSDCTDSSGGDTGGDVLRSTHALVDIQGNVQPTIQFTDLHGQSYVVDDSICGDYGIGEQVTLWYVPSNPNSFSVEQDGVTLVVLGALFGGFGLIALVIILVSLGRLAFLAVMLSRSGGQPTAFVGSPAQMGGWQMNSPPQMVGQPISGSVNHRLGEVVSIAGHWAITVTNAYPSQGAEMVSAAPGRYYLMLLLSLRNISQEPLNFGQTTFRLSDNVGAEYQRAVLLEGAAPGFVQQGDQASVTLAYDVPGALRQFRLSLYLSTSSLAQATWDIAL